MATLQSICLFTKVNRSSNFLAILLAIFLLVVTAGSAFSDGGHGGAPLAMNPVGPFNSCGTEEQALKTLGKYGEKPVGWGIAGGHLATLYTNPKTGSWTFVVYFSRNRACFLRMGHDWQAAPIGDPL